MKTNNIFAHSLAVVFLHVLLASTVFAHTKCVENAKIVKPNLSEETRAKCSDELTKAGLRLVTSESLLTLNLKNNPDVGAGKDALIWLGRRNAYLGNYKDAIGIYTEGIQKYPNDARFYRHRGHRLITLRCFDDAIADLRKPLD